MPGIEFDFYHGVKLLALGYAAVYFAAWSVLALYVTQKSPRPPG